MTTRDVFKLISKYFNEHHMGVCSLGRTAEECFKNLPNNQILFLDCLGSVTDTAIGISIGCPNIWIDAFDTDGSFLSNLASTYSIASLWKNLTYFTLFIFDNGLLESGGGIKSRTIDLKWEHLFATWDMDLKIILNCQELAQYLDMRYSILKPQVIILNIDNETLPNNCTKDIDGKESKYMFKRYLNDFFNKGIIKPCVKN